MDKIKIVEEKDDKDHKEITLGLQEHFKAEVGVMFAQNKGENKIKYMDHGSDKEEFLELVFGIIYSLARNYPDIFQDVIDYKKEESGSSIKKVNKKLN